MFYYFLQVKYISIIFGKEWKKWGMVNGRCEELFMMGNVMPLPLTGCFSETWKKFMVELFGKFSVILKSWHVKSFI